MRLRRPAGRGRNGRGRSGSRVGGPPQHLKRHCSSPGEKGGRASPPPLQRAERAGRRAGGSRHREGAGARALRPAGPGPGQPGAVLRFAPEDVPSGPPPRIAYAGKKPKRAKFPFSWFYSGNRRSQMGPAGEGARSKPGKPTTACGRSWEHTHMHTLTRTRSHSGTAPSGRGSLCQPRGCRQGGAQKAFKARRLLLLTPSPG